MTPNAGGRERSIIESEGSLIRQVEGIEAPAAIRRLNDARGFGRWNASFSKLRILSATEFEKIVLLDSDMLINRNIDCLFDRPHLSACVAGQAANPSWRDLNSGCLIIEPEANLCDCVMHTLGLLDDETLASYQAIGDQDLLHLVFRIGPIGTICTFLKNITCFPTMQRDTRGRAFWLAVPPRLSTSPPSQNHGTWAYMNGFSWRNEHSGGEALPRFDISVCTIRYWAMRPSSWISGP